jgi:hypothetical protein
MISSSIHFPENHIIPFFFMTKFSIVYIHIYTYVYHAFFSLAGGHLGWFYSLATVNSAMINVGVQVSLLYADFDGFV